MRVPRQHQIAPNSRSRVRKRSDRIIWVNTLASGGAAVARAAKETEKENMPSASARFIRGAGLLTVGSKQLGRVHYSVQFVERHGVQEGKGTISGSPHLLYQAAFCRYLTLNAEHCSLPIAIKLVNKNYAKINTVGSISGVVDRLMLSHGTIFERG